MDPSILDHLVKQNTTKILFVVMDGLGGLPYNDKGETELEAAQTPHLDALARQSECGLFDPVAPWVSPGSGPGHFALFGYDPVTFNIGRGVLEAAGVGFEFTENDVVARINFATLDREGNIIDRRAGRIDSETGRRICEKLQRGLDLQEPGVTIIIEPVKEYRAMVVFRGEDLSGELEDTDPQQTGVPPRPPRGRGEQAERTVRIVSQFLEQAKQILADEPKANMVLLRGFAKYRRYPTFQERFGLKGLAIANYPMYRGITRLLGMDLHPITPDIETEFKAAIEQYHQYDFLFLHVKPTDARGEDGDFAGKVRLIEEVDRYIPSLLHLKPDVLVVTADHSTPAKLKSHSWHPVPVLLHSPYCRPSRIEKFGERACAAGTLGRQPMVNLIGLVLAHALRLEKYGA